MDELNLYDDLDEFQEQHEKKSKELQEVEDKLQQSLINVEELKKENKSLKKSIRRMEVSFQSLLDTARSEIKRKDREIERLNRENDDICFRRKIPNKQLHANEKTNLEHHSAYNPFRSNTIKNIQVSVETTEMPSGYTNVGGAKSKNSKVYRDDGNKHTPSIDFKSNRSGSIYHSDDNQISSNEHTRNRHKSKDEGRDFKSKYICRERTTKTDSKKVESVCVRANKNIEVPTKNKHMQNTNLRDCNQSDGQKDEYFGKKQKEKIKTNNCESSEDITQKVDRKPTIITKADVSQKVNIKGRDFVVETTQDKSNSTFKVDQNPHADINKESEKYMPTRGTMPETNQFCSPRKEALFNEIFGKSPSESGRLVTSPVCSNSLLHIKSILGNNSKVKCIRPATTSADEYKDVNRSMSTPMNEAIINISSASNTPNSASSISNNKKNSQNIHNSHSNESEIDKCFIPILNVACVNLTEVLDDNIVNEVDFVQIPGLDLCPQWKKTSTKENTSRSVDIELNIEPRDSGNYKGKTEVTVNEIAIGMEHLPLKKEATIEKYSGLTVQGVEVCANEKLSLGTKSSCPSNLNKGNKNEFNNPHHLNKQLNRDANSENLKSHLKDSMCTNFSIETTSANFERNQISKISTNYSLDKVLSHENVKVGVVDIINSGEMVPLKNFYEKDKTSLKSKQHESLENANKRNISTEPLFKGSSVKIIEPYENDLCQEDVFNCQSVDINTSGDACRSANSHIDVDSIQHEKVEITEIKVVQSDKEIEQLQAELNSNPTNSRSNVSRRDEVETLKDLEIKQNETLSGLCIPSNAEQSYPLMQRKAEACDNIVNEPTVNRAENEKSSSQNKTSRNLPQSCKSSPSKTIPHKGTHDNIELHMPESCIKVESIPKKSVDKIEQHKIDDPNLPLPTEVVEEVQSERREFSLLENQASSSPQVTRNTVLENSNMSLNKTDGNRSENMRESSEFSPNNGAIDQKVLNLHSEEKCSSSRKDNTSTIPTSTEVSLSFNSASKIDSNIVGMVYNDSIKGSPSEKGLVTLSDSIDFRDKHFKSENDSPAKEIQANSEKTDERRIEVSSGNDVETAMEGKNSNEKETPNSDACTEAIKNLKKAFSKSTDNLYSQLPKLTEKSTQSGPDNSINIKSQISNHGDQTKKTCKSDTALNESKELIKNVSHTLVVEQLVENESREQYSSVSNNCTTFGDNSVKTKGVFSAEDKTAAAAFKLSITSNHLIELPNVSGSYSKPLEPLVIEIQNDTKEAIKKSNNESNLDKPEAVTEAERNYGRTESEQSSYVGCKRPGPRETNKESLNQNHIIKEALNTEDILMQSKAQNLKEISKQPKEAKNLKGSLCLDKCLDIPDELRNTGKNQSNSITSRQESEIPHLCASAIENKDLIKHLAERHGKFLTNTGPTASAIKITKEINIEGEIVEVVKNISTPNEFLILSTNDNIPEQATEILTKTQESELGISISECGNDEHVALNKMEIMSTETKSSIKKNDQCQARTAVNAISPPLSDTYNSAPVLPSISTISPTPSNFSGIFSKKSSPVTNEDEDHKSKKKGKHKEFILPAASVLCNFINLGNTTKSRKKLHWELLDNKNEMTEIEDDADVDTTDEEEVKFKEERIKNASPQKTSFSETDTQTENTSLVTGLRQEKGKFKNLEHLPPQKRNPIAKTVRKNTASITQPYKRQGHKAKKVIKDNMEQKHRCTKETILKKALLPDHNCLPNNNRGRNIADINSNIDNSVKILSTSVEKLEISDEPCSSNDCNNMRKSFKNQIEYCRNEDAYNSSKIYHNPDTSTDERNNPTAEEMTGECSKKLEVKENCDIKISEEKFLDKNNASSSYHDTKCPKDLSISEETSDTNLLKKNDCGELNQFLVEEKVMDINIDLLSISSQTCVENKVSPKERDDSNNEKLLKPKPPTKFLLGNKFESASSGNKVASGLKSEPTNLCLSSFRIPKIRKYPENIPEKKQLVEGPAHESVQSRSDKELNEAKILNDSNIHHSSSTYKIETTKEIYNSKIVGDKKKGRHKSNQMKRHQKSFQSKKSLSCKSLNTRKRATNMHRRILDSSSDGDQDDDNKANKKELYPRERNKKESARTNAGGTAVKMRTKSMCVERKAFSNEESQKCTSESKESKHALEESFANSSEGKNSRRRMETVPESRQQKLIKTRRKSIGLCSSSNAKPIKKQSLSTENVSNTKRSEDGFNTENGPQLQTGYNCSNTLKQKLCISRRRKSRSESRNLDDINHEKKLSQDLDSSVPGTCSQSINSKETSEKNDQIELNQFSVELKNNLDSHINCDHSKTNCSQLSSSDKETTEKSIKVLQKSLNQTHHLDSLSESPESEIERDGKKRSKKTARKPPQMIPDLNSSLVLEQLGDSKGNEKNRSTKLKTEPKPLLEKKSTHSEPNFDSANTNLEPDLNCERESLNKSKNVQLTPVHLYTNTLALGFEYKNTYEQKQDKQTPVEYLRDSDSKTDSIIQMEPDSDQYQNSELKIASFSSEDEEPVIKKVAIAANEFQTPLAQGDTQTSLTTASNPKQRRKRVVKVLSTSAESPTNPSNTSQSSSTNQISPLSSFILNHPIFNTEVSTQSEIELGASLPLALNPTDDNKFREIDSKLHEIFQSPKYTADYKISTTLSAHDLKSNIATDESMGCNEANTEIPLNATQENDAPTMLNNSEIKHLSLGSSDYRFEKVSDNVINLFISRKRKRKRST